MKKLLIAFIVLLGAVGIGYLMHKDPGYVLIAYGGYKAEYTLWKALLILVIFYLLCYFVWRLFKHTTNLSSRINRWQQNKREQRSIKLTNQGLCELAEGQWKKAESSLTKSATQSATPLINYLAAAKAAHEQNAYDRRDNYLRKAHRNVKGTELAVGLTQAQLQMYGKQWEQASATLQHLNQVAPKHKHVLKLLSHTHKKLGDWLHLHSILPDIRKHKILPDEDYNELETNIYLGLLNQAIKQSNPGALDEAWEKIPKQWRTQPRIAQSYITELLQQNRGVEAAKAIENTLAKEWNPRLVKLYAQAQSNDNEHQIKQSEKWLKKHPHDTVLLNTLSQLCVRESYWGKAKDYLNNSIKLSPTPEAYQTLGQIYEALNEKELALEQYRQAANIATK